MGDLEFIEQAFAARSRPEQVRDMTRPADEIANSPGSTVESARLRHRRSAGVCSSARIKHRHQSSHPRSVLREKTERCSLRGRRNVILPGQYYDAETGLNDNYFRDYDPATGRYVESDPIGLDGGLSTYAYALGDPIGKSDESGLIVILPGVVGAVVEVLTGRPPKVPGQFACNARCPTVPVQCPDPGCPEAVYGYGVGRDLLTARNASRAAANAKVPAGCQLKHHCTYKCTGPKGDAIYPSR